VDCQPKDYGDDITSLLNACRPSRDGANNWSVNGVLGGTGVTGTIVGTTRGTGNDVATFTAPSTAPSPNTVGVSAQAPLVALTGKVLVFAYITIGCESNGGTAQFCTYTGTSTGTLDSGITTSAQVNMVCPNCPNRQWRPASASKRLLRPGRGHLDTDRYQPGLQP
jgi:hypothetical protein